MVARSVEITAGQLISGTLETVRANAGAGLLFVAVFTVAGSIADATAVSNAGATLLLGGLFQLAVGVGMIVGYYLLLEWMLKNAGLQTHSGARRYFAFVGQIIVMAIGLVVGLVLLIIPGIILMARWALAQPLLVGRGDGVFKALGDSWELTRGHTITIILAAIVLLIGFFILAAAVSAGAGLGGHASLSYIVAMQLIGNIGSVVSTAFMVTLLGFLDPSAGEMEEIFA